MAAVTDLATSPAGIVVCYLVATLVVVPIVWWAVCTPGRREERAMEARAAARRTHPSEQP